MNSVERVRAILAERNIPVSKIEKDLGYSNGYIKKIKRGAFPDKRLEEIAEYLSVSSYYLLHGEEETTIKIAGLSDDELRILALYREVNIQGKEYIFQQMSIASQLYTKNHSVSSADSNMGLIEKFRRLDERGKSAVMAVLNHECEILSELASSASEDAG